MTPSLIVGDGNWAVKSDSLLGYKVIDSKYYPREFTFTRATTGTRVNEAGLVELVPYNLLSWSEQVDNAYWIKTTNSASWQGTGSAPVITANYGIAPNGTMTSDRVQLNLNGGTTSNDRSGYYASITVSTPNTYGCSIYIKPLNGEDINSIMINPVGILAAAGAETSQSYEVLADGWYRITRVATTASTIGTFRIQLFGNNGLNSLDCLIWGAQLVEGTEPLDYLPTTDRLDIPRIDYSTGEAALLLEPQRTNLISNSNTATTNSWGTLLSERVNLTYANDPNISNDINVITASDTAINNQHRLIFGSGYDSPYTGTKTYCLSAKIKANGINELSFLILGETITGTIDLTDGGNDLASVGSVFVSCTTTLLSNGYVDVELVWTKTNATSAAPPYIILFHYNGGISYLGDGGGTKLYGVQLEAGSYPTSYIPTTSAIVTRNADVCSKTGATDFIGQTEGTLYAEFNLTNLIGDRTILEIGADNANRIRMRVNGNIISASVVLAGSVVGTVTFNSQPLGNYKFAYAYKQNDFQAYLNGNAGTAVTSGNIPSSMSIIGVGTRIVLGADIFSDSISTAVLYKERLSDSELATLTTL